MRFNNIINKNKKVPLEYKEKYQFYRLLNMLFGIVLCASFIFLFYLSEIKFGLIVQLLIILYFFVNLFLILDSLKTNQISIFLNLVLSELLFYNLLKEELVFIPLQIDIIKIDKFYIGIFFFILDLAVILAFYYFNIIYPEQKLHEKH